MVSAAAQQHILLKRRFGLLIAAVFLVASCLFLGAPSAAYAAEEEEMDAPVEALAVTSVTVSPSSKTFNFTRSTSQSQIFSVSIPGSSKGFTVTLSGQHRKETTYEVFSTTQFQVIVDLTEPSGVINATVTSKEDPSVSTVVPITVKSKPLIDELSLVYNESAFIAHPSTTGRELTSTIRTALQTDSSIYKVDTTNGGAYSHLCYRTNTGYESLHESDEPLVAGREYFLQLNFEEINAYWPSDLEDIAVTINGQDISAIEGAHVLWYSAAYTGSVNVYIPIPWSDEAVVGISAYFTSEYSAGRAALVYLKSDYLENSLSVPLFRGQTMYYVPDYEYWCTVVDPGTEIANVFDFSVTRVNSIEEKRNLIIAKPGYGGSGVPGDVNMNGTLTIVDAQNAYDAARGAYTMRTDLPARSWLIADVNNSKYLDSSDAFCIQRALFFGW